MVRQIAKIDEVALLDGGREAFPRMLEAIGAARTRIHLEMYTFDHDAATT